MGDGQNFNSQVRKNNQIISMNIISKSTYNVTIKGTSLWQKIQDINYQHQITKKIVYLQNKECINLDTF